MAAARGVLRQLDPAERYSWVRRLSATVFPGPNHLSFTATTYRGELVHNVSSDAATLAAADADRFVEEIVARTGARHEQTTTYDASAELTTPA
jgi:hypothetical protein